MAPEAPPIRYVVRGAPGELFNWAQLAEANPDIERNSGVPLEILIEGPGGTGKSQGIASFLLWCCAHWPGTHVLAVRQTRASMTDSVCVSIEDSWPFMLPGVALTGPVREHRERYVIGESEIVLGSMENPNRLYSTKWDIVWFEEIREARSRKPWLEFIRSLRSFVTPFRMMIGSTNPDHPKLWINQRFPDAAVTTGPMRRLLSRHVDNPAYFDEELNEWTPKGQAYIGDLSRLPGVLGLRLYHGKWAASEGVIWQEYDPQTHDVELERDADGWVTQAALDRIQARDFYAGCDFGFDAPGAFGVWAFCADKKRYLIAEVYRSHQLISWWADRVFELHQHYKIDAIFCDPSRPDAIEAFNVRLGVPRSGAGAIAVEANNAVFQGIECVRRLLSTTDKGPFLFFDVNALYGGADIELIDAQEPTCTTEEIPQYVYARKSGETDGEGIEKPKDKPDPRCADHGADGVLRYAMMGLEYAEPSKRRQPKYVGKELGRMLDHDKVGRPKLDKAGPISQEWDVPGLYD